MTSKIDLHVHTTASDGVLSPEELVRLSLKRGLEVIAIADHDTTEGIPLALKAAEGASLTVIPAIEVSTDIPRAEVHILGYFIDYSDEHLQQTLIRLRSSRIDRAKRMVQKLAQLGMPIEWQRVLEIAGSGSIGRPHIAEALFEKGYVSSPSEAFAKYISRTGPAYVERYKLTPSEAIKLIVNAKGLAALAHPIIPGPPLEKLDLETLLPELVSAGLGGIEAYYTGYTPEIERHLLNIAKRFGLVPTGGSDYHGWGPEPAELGAVEVPRSALEALYARAGRK